MSYRFELTVRVNTGQREELRGDIPDDEWDVLLLFLARFDRLAETRMAAGSQVNLKIEFAADGSASVTGLLPPPDDVDAFVYRMRPFVLQNEPTSFYKVCNIISRRVAHPAVPALLRQQRDLFSTKDFQRQIELSSNGTLLNTEETLKLWLNGAGEYHGDDAKAKQLAALEQPFAADALRPLYISMLLDKAKAVAALAEIVKLLAKRGVRGREIRFGGLSINSPQPAPNSDER